jgi:hypothetical protein
MAPLIPLYFSNNVFLYCYCIYWPFIWNIGITMCKETSLNIRQYTRIEIFFEIFSKIMLTEKFDARKNIYSAELISFMTTSVEDMQWWARLSDNNKKIFFVVLAIQCIDIRSIIKRHLLTYLKIIISTFLSILFYKKEFIPRMIRSKRENRQTYAYIRQSILLLFYYLTTTHCCVKTSRKL